MAEIRVYYQNQFLCRAICPDLSTETITLKEIKKARNQRRLQLKQQIQERISIVDALMGGKKKTNLAPKEPEIISSSQSNSPALKRYLNE